MRNSSAGSVESRGDEAVPTVKSTSSRSGAQSGPQSLGEARRLVPVGVGEDHGELVAADARRGVAAAHGAAQREPELAQQVVADGVPELVVDRLEAVEVERAPA